MHVFKYPLIFKFTWSAMRKYLLVSCFKLKVGNWIFSFPICKIKKMGEKKLTGCALYQCL